MSGWRIKYHDGFTKDVDPLPKNLQRRIGKIIAERIETAPEKYGEPLHGSLSGCWKVRTGDYRIVYEIDNAAHCVTVWGVQHRRKVYPAMTRRLLRVK